jgi:hypothetical protein
LPITNELEKSRQVLLEVRAAFFATLFMAALWQQQATASLETSFRFAIESDNNIALGRDYHFLYHWSGYHCSRDQGTPYDT